MDIITSQFTYVLALIGFTSIAAGAIHLLLKYIEYLDRQDKEKEQMNQLIKDTHFYIRKLYSQYYKENK